MQRIQTFIKQWCEAKQPCCNLSQTEFLDLFVCQVSCSLWVQNQQCLSTRCTNTLASQFLWNSNNTLNACMLGRWSVGWRFKIIISPSLTWRYTCKEQQFERIAKCISCIKMHEKVTLVYMPSEAWSSWEQRICPHKHGHNNPPTAYIFR